MPASRKTSPKNIEAAERKNEALQLRKKGHTYDQIAKKMGFSSRATAFRSVQSAIRDITKEPAKDVLELEVSRLDAMLSGLWEKATEGDDKAVIAALRIMDRRAKYLGLDQAPEQESSALPAPSERAIKLDSMLREYLQQRGTNTRNDSDKESNDE